METRCVPFKFTIEGQEIEAYLTDKNWELVLKAINKKKTGYERADYNKIYFTEGCGYVQSYADWGKDIDESYYKCANYYSDKTVADNNTRADNLMRQLRRFAVEHREKELNFRETVYWIGYDFKSLNDLVVLWNEESLWAKSYGTIYFDSKKAAQLAIETFKDELIWYFTEYKDSL